MGSSTVFWLGSISSCRNVSWFFQKYFKSSLNPGRQEKKSNKLFPFSLVMYANYSASYFIPFL